MAIHYTSPWDKQTKTLIVSQPEKICYDCGGFFVCGRCLRCKGHNYIVVMEHEAEGKRAQITRRNERKQITDAIKAALPADVEYPAELLEETRKNYLVKVGQVAK